MKNIILIAFTLINLIGYAQVYEQNIQKTDGSVVTYLNDDIDSIRFNNTTGEMEVILNNATMESHKISEISQAGFSEQSGNGGNCNNTPTAIVDITNPTTGKTWMDRNLGASQVATSNTDNASYGDLYQWGRSADGHQCRNSATTSILSSNSQPGHSKFILSPDAYPYDWISTSNDNLWQGVNGVNNPCPNGYRLPTQAEWEAERQSPSWGGMYNNPTPSFPNGLKLPLAGVRNYGSGDLEDVGEFGYYWSSTLSYGAPIDMTFFTGIGTITINYKAGGVSVRCIKD